MKRVLTAALLIPVVAWAVIWGPTVAFLAIVAIVALLCWREYRALVAGCGIEAPGPIGYGAGLVVLLVPHLDLPTLTLLVLAGLALVIRRDEFTGYLAHSGALVLGLLYIFGAWRAAIALRAISPYWLLLALTINWVGDSAAYYVGKAIGRHKLAPSISPAKSVEGSVASVVVALAFAYFFLKHLLSDYPLAPGLAIALAGNVAGQIGDLVESALKRGAGLKDSGTMLPGHGGWLDRVDSSLFAIPVVYFLVTQGANWSWRRPWL